MNRRECLAPPTGLTAWRTFPHASVAGCQVASARTGTKTGTDAIRARFKVAYSDFTLDVDLTLPAKGVSALFGHSGSGKTTLLRAIAGLIPADQGYFSLANEVWQDGATSLPTCKRPLGYVFQEANLFPHLSAHLNIEYGRRRSATALGKASLDRIIEILGIGALLERKPDALSGGERQRVAVARALAVGPRLLMMDEPLAALDLRRKQEILPYLERLRDELEIPILYVSHAPDEVARLADHLVVLEAGRVLAQGPIQAVLSDVATPIRLGEDVGAVLEGVVAERDAHWHLARVEFPGGSLWVHDEGQAIGRLRLRLLARDVSLSIAAPVGTSILNHLAARIEAIGDDFHPAFALVQLGVDGQRLLARVSRRSLEDLALTPGMTVWAQVKSVAVIR